MTAQARQNLTSNKARYLAWINDIDRIMHEIAVNGAASGSVSAGGGSQSYTRIDLDKLRKITPGALRRSSGVWPVFRPSACGE